MSRLTQEELRNALDLVGRVQAAPDLPAYRREVLRVRHLVPGISVSYNEVNAETGETHALIDPPDAAFEGVEEAFARCAHEHPVIRHHRETGDTGPCAASDFISAEELHALDLYRLIWGPMGVEDQLSVVLPSPPEIVVGLAINRAARGFSDAERELLALVQPHLGRAFESLQSEAAARRSLALLEDAARAGARVLITADSEGRVLAASDGALRWTGQQLGADVELNGTLPAPIDTWCSEDAARRTLPVESGTLVVTVQRARDVADRRLVLLELNPDLLADDRLAALGLSERESDVVRLLVRGCSTAELAHRLAISPHTAEKHISRIHRKLGVHSRSGAVARVLGLP